MRQHARIALLLFVFVAVALAGCQANLSSTQTYAPLPRCFRLTSDVYLLRFSSDTDPYLTTPASSSLPSLERYNKRSESDLSSYPDFKHINRVVAAGTIVRIDRIQEETTIGSGAGPRVYGHLEQPDGTRLENVRISADFFRRTTEGVILDKTWAVACETLRQP